MNTSSSKAETSVEFAIDNALERIKLVSDDDRYCLYEEYKEWLSSSRLDIEILITDYLGDYL